MKTQLEEYNDLPVPTVDEFAAEIHRLDALLQDAHPGLATWQDMFAVQTVKILRLILAINREHGEFTHSE